MTKQEKFLWIVQTALLVNVNRLTAKDIQSAVDPSDFSMTGNWGAIVDAIRASELIPEKMTADEAVGEYCTFMFSNQRKTVEDGSKKLMTCPMWFAR